MADIQIQKRRNPKTDRKEAYRTLRWHDPVTRKRKAKSLGFVSAKEAAELKTMCSRKAPAKELELATRVRPAILVALKVAADNRPDENS